MVINAKLAPYIFFKLVTLTCTLDLGKSFPVTFAAGDDNVTLDAIAKDLPDVKAAALFRVSVFPDPSNTPLASKLTCKCKTIVQINSRDELYLINLPLQCYLNYYI